MTVNFHIIGNVIFGNGLSSKSAASGLAIRVDVQPQGAPANELAFNSISRNSGADVGQGVHCSGGTALAANSNIIWNNGITPSTPTPPNSLLPQVAGAGCSHRFSDIGPFIDLDIANMMGNLNADPMFVDEGVSGNPHGQGSGFPAGGT